MGDIYLACAERGNLHQQQKFGNTVLKMYIIEHVCQFIFPKHYTGLFEL